MLQGECYCRMLQGEHSAIHSIFIKLPFVVKIFVLSIFEWPFYTGFKHQSFVSTPPPPPPPTGIAWLKCRAITFWLSPQCRGSAGVITLGHLPCLDFLLCRVGQRAGLLTCYHQLVPTGWRLIISGLWKVKIIPAHSRRWGSSGYKWLVHYCIHSEQEKL